MLQSLAGAQRPLLLVGGGLRSAQAVGLVREFVDLAQVPVINSLMGVDILPYSHPFRVGMLGSYGNRWANLAVGQADFLLVMGSRLDIRQTGADTNAFRQGRTIYHVDCEAGEINNRVPGSHAIVADLKPFLHQAIAQAEAITLPSYSGWQHEIAELRQKWPDTAELQDLAGINPNTFLHQLSGASQQAAAFVVDVGQHQMWAAQSLELGPQQRFLTSGGMGAMGFALPAAVGATVAAGKAPVVMVAGDGGFQLNLQELQTIVRNKLPVKMVILNNQCHGMVRQFQQSYFDERYQSTYWGYSAPDFVQVAEAYGIQAKRISDPAEVAAGVAEVWATPEAPYLLDVAIDTFANAYPKIAFGRPMTEMEPFAQPIAMEGT
jgi:acetolactate synthase-1/2/3 large subunit